MKPQYAEQRSFRDVRRGIALIGVGHASLAGRRFTCEGVRVEAMEYRDLALLVRALRNDEVGRVGDASWMAREERLVLRLCDRLIAKSSLLPAKPGTVFASRSELNETAKQTYGRWRRALGRVMGKQEWLVLGYAGPHSAPAACGSAVLGKVLVGRRSVIGAPFADLWHALSSVAAQGRLIVPRDPRAAFGAALLVAAEHATAFRHTMLRAVAECAATGVTVYYAGPRAPFHFT